MPPQPPQAEVIRLMLSLANEINKKVGSPTTVMVRIDSNASYKVTIDPENAEIPEDVIEDILNLAFVLKCKKCRFEVDRARIIIEKEPPLI